MYTNTQLTLVYLHHLLYVGFEHPIARIAQHIERRGLARTLRLLCADLVLESDDGRRGDEDALTLSGVSPNLTPRS